MTLMTFQPAPRKTASSSWMILPLPRTGPSSRCRLQLTTKIRLSRCSRPATPSAPIDSGSSISPSPTKHHTRLARGVDEAAQVEVAVDVRLVDGGDRAEAHRDGGVLPEVGEETRMGVAREAVAADLMAEVVELGLAQPAFHVGAGVDAGRGVALEEDLVAEAAVGLAAEEVVEAHLVERGRAGVGREVAADAFGPRVGPRRPWRPRSSGCRRGSGVPGTRRRGTRARRRPGWCSRTASRRPRGNRPAWCAPARGAS